MLRQWWVQKYGLPPTHEAFVSQSVGELFLEYYEDLLVELDALEAAFEKNPEDLDGRRIERMGIIRKVLLGEEAAMITGDPLIDKWEREIREGKTPNLDEGLDDG